MRVVITRAVEEGEPVTISYGPLASKVSSTSERQAYLQRAYFFRCECAACRPPAAIATMTQLNRSDDKKDGAGQRPIPHVTQRPVAAARSKRTEFACVQESDCCPGTLLVGVPPLASVASASSSSSQNIRKGDIGLWCDHCGNHVPFGAANELLREDEEDRRLWDEGIEAVSRFEKGETTDIEYGGGTGRPPSSSTPPEGSTPEDKLLFGFSAAASSGSAGTVAGTDSALSLVLDRVKWRDARLSPLSMRRAVAHDMHARILAGRKDYAGAADACGRALSILVKRFALEDQELGVEFLKLAELCFNAGWIDKCYRACRKARLSLGVLAAGDEQLVALDNLQALCAANRR
ncbi:unnamed protein product [Hapterophycus canaliculatus]